MARFSFCLRFDFELPPKCDVGYHVTCVCVRVSEYGGDGVQRKSVTGLGGLARASRRRPATALAPRTRSLRGSGDSQDWRVARRLRGRGRPAGGREAT